MPCLTRTLPRLTVFLLSTFAAFSAAAHGNHTHWGYTGHDSPESWGNLSEEFRLCSTGKNQSPVNITETVSGKLPAIKVNYKPSTVNVENNGHTIQVNYPEGGNTLTVNGRTYTLKQFHFHVPSENQIKGRTFPMEAHFVHLDENRQPLVLAVLYEAGKTNDRLAPIWNVMPMKEGRKGKPRQSLRRRHPAAETAELLPLCRFADHSAVQRRRIVAGIENLRPHRPSTGRKIHPRHRFAQQPPRPAA